MTGSAWCRACRQPYPLEDLLLVTPVHGGPLFYVCRPSNRAVGDTCFRRTVGSIAVHTIEAATAVRKDP